METLKSLEEIAEADERSTAFSLINSATGEVLPKTLENHREIIEQFKLHSGVPEDVRNHFVTAQNLWLYTWFVYRFYPVAEQHVLTSLEFALIERIGSDKMKEFKKKRQLGLSYYIEYAIKQEWIRNEDFSIYRGDPSRDILGGLRRANKVRNMYAHGSSTLHPIIGYSFSVCTDFINELFKKSVVD